MQPVARNLNFPTSVTLDAEGRMYIAESGVAFDGAPSGGAVSRVNPDGTLTRLYDGLRSPVNGLAYSNGSLFISEGGYPGRISRLSLTSAEWQTVVDDLPGFGNYHTNMCAIGPEDGKLYFSQGAMTNSGIIGLDSHDLGWLRKVPHNHDIPGYDITLTGFNLETIDPEAEDGRRVRTGAFVPFGTPTVAGQHIRGRVPCTSSVMRCNPDGTGLELVAWGLRNAYGLGFLADGRLLATEQGADDRGSRPVVNCPDFLYEVRKGSWYGWPDFIGGIPVTDARFRDGSGPVAEFLLANHAELPGPESPLLEFELNSSAVKFAVVPAHFGRWEGNLVVAMFGDEGPLTSATQSRVGRKLVRVDPSDWSVHPTKTLPLKRPIDVAFARCGSAAFVLDFGDFEITPEKGVAARAGSGALWKLSQDFMEF
jgi:glucose/arabinose dehydrogenase